MFLIENITSERFDRKMYFHVAGPFLEHRRAKAVNSAVTPALYEDGS